MAQAVADLVGDLLCGCGAQRKGARGGSSLRMRPESPPQSPRNDDDDDDTFVLDDGAHGPSSSQRPAHEALVARRTRPGRPGPGSSSSSRWTASRKSASAHRGGRALRGGLLDGEHPWVRALDEDKEEVLPPFAEMPPPGPPPGVPPRTPPHAAPGGVPEPPSPRTSSVSTMTSDDLDADADEYADLPSMVEHAMRRHRRSGGHVRSSMARRLKVLDSRDSSVSSASTMRSSSSAGDDPSDLDASRCRKTAVVVTPESPHHRSLRKERAPEAPPPPAKLLLKPTPPPPKLYEKTFLEKRREPSPKSAVRSVRSSH